MTHISFIYEINIWGGVDGRFGRRKKFFLKKFVLLLERLKNLNFLIANCSQIISTVYMYNVNGLRKEKYLFFCSRSNHSSRFYLWKKYCAPNDKQIYIL